jgi:hypothetical protein
VSRCWARRALCARGPRQRRAQEAANGAPEGKARRSASSPPCSGRRISRNRRPRRRRVVLGKVNLPGCSRQSSARRPPPRLVPPARRAPPRFFPEHLKHLPQAGFSAMSRALRASMSAAGRGAGEASAAGVARLEAARPPLRRRPEAPLSAPAAASAPPDLRRVWRGAPLRGRGRRGTTPPAPSRMSFSMTVSRETSVSTRDRRMSSAPAPCAGRSASRNRS